MLLKIVHTPLGMKRVFNLLVSKFRTLVKIAILQSGNRMSG